MPVLYGVPPSLMWALTTSYICDVGDVNMMPNFWSARQQLLSVCPPKLMLPLSTLWI